jgi:hypothetical protein
MMVRLESCPSTKEGKAGVASNRMGWRLLLQAYPLYGGYLFENGEGTG